MYLVRNTEKSKISLNFNKQLQCILYLSLLLRFNPKLSNMPIKAIFQRKSSKQVRVHSEILKAIRATPGQTITETVNRALAQIYAPHLLDEFDTFKKIPLKFPHRKTKNRFTRD